MKDLKTTITGVLPAVVGLATAQGWLSVEIGGTITAVGVLLIGYFAKDKA